MEEKWGRTHPGRLSNPKPVNWSFPAKSPVPVNSGSVLFICLINHNHLLLSFVFYARLYICFPPPHPKTKPICVLIQLHRDSWTWIISKMLLEMLTSRTMWSSSRSIGRPEWMVHVSINMLSAFFFFFVWSSAPSSFKFIHVIKCTWSHMVYHHRL